MDIIDVKPAFLKNRQVKAFGFIQAPLRKPRNFIFTALFLPFFAPGFLFCLLGASQFNRGSKLIPGQFDIAGIEDDKFRLIVFKRFLKFNTVEFV